MAVDTNILIYAHREELPLHAAALRRLTELAEGPSSWGLPIFCLGEFVRVVTHPRVLRPPSPLEEALSALEALLASPSLLVLTPGEAYWPLFREIAREARATGNLAFDAQIAALCREHGVRVLLTEDRDFRRFRGLQIERLT
ncbi:MAG: PIN domain-containing protein [Armatimonadota bacterium]|nr:PIN domain-containing protein [Armatimonadota bacterium]MDR7452037.1 PIN domain-containing protein [Armatimonadota bacterium]MDR7467928.1 PIN domain-containing protein [Armatimonadota bacterium]